MCFNLVNMIMVGTVCFLYLTRYNNNIIKKDRLKIVLKVERKIVVGNLL